MVLIKRATIDDFRAIADIGNISVKEAHKGSCPAEDLDEYMKDHYNDLAIQKELEDLNNIYQILLYNEKPAGFSKILLNAEHENIKEKNVAKLDRIYLLNEYFDLKLGIELLKANIELAKQNKQAGIWLVTWVGNSRAINFYTKAGFEVIGSYHFQVTPTTSNLNHQMFLKLESERIEK